MTEQPANPEETRPFADRPEAEAMEAMLSPEQRRDLVKPEIDKAAKALPEGEPQLDGDTGTAEAALDRTMAFDNPPQGDSRPSAAPLSFSPGMRGKGGVEEKLIGGYRLQRLLGEGGMGRVYEATDADGRRVALKLLSPQLASSSDAIERFKLEGVIASAINHPHCVFVHRADEDQGTPFIAMELMTGSTLKDLVAERGPLPVREALSLILQCIDGLIEAHSLGMIHRDIKPANCYLDDCGGVKIGDFGLARSLVGDSELTRTGAFLGTPLYASPEQLLGDLVTEQSDIYSLSATLFYLLAGKAPFDAPNAQQVIAKIASADPPSFKSLGIQLPARLERAVRRGLARDRTKRFMTLQQFRDELAPLIDDHEETARLPRRCIAYGIDLFYQSVLMSIVTVFATLQWTAEADAPFIASWIDSAVMAAYFFAFESIFAASPGKYMMQLRVHQTEFYGKPTVRQIAIRVAAFTLLYNVVGWVGILILFQMNVSGPSLAASQSLIGWTSFLIANGINYWFWRRSGKRQVFHEWCSGTVTRYHQPRAEQSKIDLPDLDWSPNYLPLSEGPFPVPARLGRIETCAWLPTRDGSHWLAARDAVVDRSIWVQLTPLNSPALCVAREMCTRRARMRFVESGQTDSFRWDAFIAPAGAPLPVWREHTPIPWEAVRRVLHSTIEEIHASDAPLAGLADWDASRVWLGKNGRVAFVEPQLDIDGSQLITPDTRSLLSSVAQLAMHAAQDSSRARAARRRVNPPPIRITEFLKRVADAPALSVDQVKEQLNAVEIGAQVATSAPRGAAGLMLSAALSLPFIILFFMLCVIATIGVYKLRSDAQQLTNLAAVAAEPQNYSELINKLPDDQVRQLTDPESVAAIQQLAATQFHQFQQSYQRLGRVERAIVQQQFLISSQLTNSEESLSELLEEPQTNVQPFGQEVPMETASERTIDIPRRGAVTINMGDTSRFSIESAWRLFDSLQAPQPSSEWAFSNRIFLRALLLTTVSLLVFAIWGGLTRGGLCLRFAGLAVVRTSGARAGMLRSGIRTLLLWIPVGLCLVACFFLVSQSVEWTTWSQNGRRILMLLPLLYLFLAFRMPQRGLHDYLSGTWLVPR